MAKKVARRTAPHRQAAQQTPITAEMTTEMATYRKDELNYSVYRPVQRSNYPEGETGDSAYRAALLDQYEGLRYKEYQYTVQNEAMKVYNLACDGRMGLGSNLGHENKHVWNAYQGTSYATAAQDTAVVHIPQMVIAMSATKRNPNPVGAPTAYCNHQNKDKKGNVKSVGAYSCAIVGSAIQMEISNEMGYTGNQNFVDLPSNQTPLASASSAVTCVQDQYQIQGKGQSLNQMILNKTIGIGDEVSIRTSNNPDVATASGCHVLTITDIKYNQDGSVKNYTVQASNNCSYMTVDPKKAAYPGNKIVQNAAQTHLWMDAQIQKERENMASLSNEEIEQRIQATRDKTVQVIDNLQATESYGATHLKGGKNYLSGVQSQYTRDFTDKKSDYTIRHQTPQILAHVQAEPLSFNIKEPDILHLPIVDPQTGKILTVADRARLSQNLQTQVGSPLPSVQAELGNGPLTVAVDTKTAVAELEKTDGRPVPQAMKEEAIEHGVPVVSNDNQQDAPAAVLDHPQQQPQQSAVVRAAVLDRGR